jgi:hypothetical protein
MQLKWDQYNGNKFFCPYCSAEFDSLNFHTHEDEQDEFICPKCKLKFHVAQEIEYVYFYAINCELIGKDHIWITDGDTRKCITCEMKQDAKWV